MELLDLSGFELNDIIHGPIRLMRNSASSRIIVDKPAAAALGYLCWISKNHH
jgi:hypothetical protein